MTGQHQPIERSKQYVYALARDHLSAEQECKCIARSHISLRQMKSRKIAVIGNTERLLAREVILINRPRDLPDSNNSGRPGNRTHEPMLHDSLDANMRARALT